MNLAQVGNLLEAIVWIAIGAVLLLRSIRATAHVRLLQVLAASFALFGLTDLVEIQSGAWWRPPWLLAVKAICVFSFCLSYWQYLRVKSSTASSSLPPSDH